MNPNSLLFINLIVMTISYFQLITYFNLITLYNSLKDVHNYYTKLVVLLSKIPNFFLIV